MKKQFTRQEMKMLVFSKMKNKGLSYDQAYKELESELKFFDKKKLDEKV